MSRGMCCRLAGTIPVNTAVFVSGGGESTSTKVSAASFMRSLAHITGGVYKSFGVPGQSGH